MDGCGRGSGLTTATQYVVVYEQTPNNWSAYVPDLPGCIAAGKTREETEQFIREAVALHVESLLEYGDPVPRPGAWTGTAEVPASLAARAAAEAPSAV